MNSDISIENGSIILSYSFIYDDSAVKAIDTKKNKLPKIENLLSYTDRLFANNKIIKYNKQSISLYFKETLYKLRIDDMNILFFENKIAILYIKLSSKDDFSDIKKLYNINKALTSFYTKKNDSYLYIGEANPLSIKLPVEKFKSKIKDLEKIDALYSQTIINALENEVPKNKVIFEDEYIELKNIQKEKEIIIETKIKKDNNFIKAFCKANYSFYDPHKGNRAYPFNDEYPEFKGRVGCCYNEKEKIKNQNEKFESDKECNRHYLYFANQKKLIEDRRKRDHIIEFIHYDTFITSLIMEYVKPNNHFLYYDTFNPRATGYVNSYITLTCDSEMINSEYKNNFISFEPLLSSKTAKGKNITNPDFFNVYQSQADIFTIGNSHNIVHIIDKDASKMKAIKEQDHFFVYLITSMQRSFILNIINSSIVNLNTLEENDLSAIKVKNTYNKLSNAMNDYNNYLTNVNFKVISNSSSVDSSYDFFRRCNEIDKLTSQWQTVSKKFNDWKSILSHVLSHNPIMSVLAIVIFGIAIKLANTGISTLLEYLKNFI